MIIKNNYLYTNVDTNESALGGTDVLLTGDQTLILMTFLRNNGGKVVDKYVTVFQDEWDETPKEPIK